MRRVIIFGIMGTLLDLGAMDPHFDRFFGDAPCGQSARQLSSSGRVK